ncbi:choline-sulfatase [Haloferula helveola]|uniref:Choline-sulfatase n=1 Tax=Haloferula helveola TaxID=490095 RepID=A0ABN6H2M7_9BACT|nr:choline-sulfatase [Haloferula helveola]
MKLPVLSLLLAGFASAQNVLLIGVDDLNDWIGCLGGHPQVQTPNMDRLARSGTLFSNAHTQASLCNSSRTALMTGRRPTTTGVYNLAPWFRSVPELRDLVSLPQAFRRADYRTALGGKIYHVFPPKKDRAAEFDEYGPPCTFGPFPAKKIVDTPSPAKLVDWGVFPEKDEQQNDYEIASWAVEYLSAKSDGVPFFLGVGFGRPHVPCYASQEWFDLYPIETLQLPPWLENDREDVPEFEWYLHWRLPEPRLPWLKESGQWKPLVQAYLASTSFVDSQVGRVLDALRKSPHADNTIVVLFSDHGWHLGEKDISGKNTLWERSTHVPLIMSGPKIPAGQKCAEPVELVDIYPTLVDLCGLDAVDGLDGLSLRPQLEDVSTSRRPAVTTQNPGNHSVRDRRWRYIRYADGSEELYDHESDPNEWRNVVDDPANRKAVERLRESLPKKEAKHVKGSGGRILENRDGEWYWEGKPIKGTERTE